MRVRGPRFVAAERPHMDNAPAVLAKQRNAMLGHQEWAAHVSREDVVPLLSSNVLKSCPSKHARVVDQNIEPAEGLGDFADRKSYALFFANIARHDQPFAAPLADLFERMPRLAHRA